MTPDGQYNTDDTNDEVADPDMGEAAFSHAASRSNSIKDDLATVVEDGKSYAEAEIAFQKTRLSFAADRGKSALILGLLALGFIHLMLIALVVGSIFALVPMVGGWLATAIVVGVLLVATILCAFVIRSKVKDVSEAFAKVDK